MTHATTRYVAALVFERLVDAADTLERIRLPDIQRNVTRWPDVVQAAVEVTELNRGRRVKGPASSEAITRMDEALVWLLWLEKDEQRIVWCRLEGMSLRRIAAFAGLAPNTFRILERAAFGLDERLNCGERAAA